MRPIFALSVLAALVLSVPSARAGEVVECGTPKELTVNRDVPANYCDIHSRRIAYKAEQERFRADLEARRENYLAPQLQALESYNGGRNTPAREEGSAEIEDGETDILE